MLRRSWGLAIVGIFTFAGLPVFGQTYNKEAVQALSKRIDAHLAKAWKKAKVTPAPKANDHVFFRRLNLDLAGRIPDLIDLDDFLADDSPDKRWMWVDKMLDDGAYQHGRHFSHVWRNLILGNQTNIQFQFQIPGFEAWLRERIDKNVPLDQTVLQLLTSQQGDPNQAFFNGRMQQSSPQLFFQVNENKPENLAGATSRLFLGVKIECAQCHAHPFAKWSKDQFWEFAAFYSAQQGMRQPKIGKGIVPNPSFAPGREIAIPGTDKVVKAKFLNGKEPKWEGSTNPRRTLAEWVVAKDNPYFAKAMAEHLWSYLMGVSLLEPILEPSDDSPITHPELLNDMAKALVENNFDAKFLIRAIVHSDAYQRSSGGVKLADKEDYQLFVRMPMRAMSPEQIFDSVWMVTNPKDKAQDFPIQPFFNPNQVMAGRAALRAQFLAKYQTQDRRHEPQTSILHSLFMMNNKLLLEETRFEKNEALQTLAAQKTDHAKRLRSLFMIVLSRPPRDNELARMVPYLEKGGVTGNLGDALSDIYWALLNSSEFVLNH